MVNLGQVSKLTSLVKRVREAKTNSLIMVIKTLIVVKITAVKITAVKITAGKITAVKITAVVVVITTANSTKTKMVQIFLHLLMKFYQVDKIWYFTQIRRRIKFEINFTNSKR